MERMATSRRRPPCFPPKPNDESLGEGREKRDIRILGRHPKLSIVTLPECENRPIRRFEASRPTIRSIVFVDLWKPASAGGILRVR